VRVIRLSKGIGTRLPSLRWAKLNLALFINGKTPQDKVIMDFCARGIDANVSGLVEIGAEAEVNKPKGSLVVQTLGVNSKSIAAALTIQSELNRTTVQNAVVAVGSIKTLLYEDGTVVFLRLVSIYLLFPGGRALVNKIISQLSRDTIVWERTCIPRTPRDQQSSP
jgi:hypothetical protein